MYMYFKSQIDLRFKISEQRAAKMSDQVGF